MLKDEILELANGLYEEALEANMYFDFVNQFQKHIKNYNAELNCSPCFYQITYGAWVKCIFIELGKIYEPNNRPNNIKRLLKKAKELSEDDFHDNIKEKYDLLDKRFNLAINKTDMHLLNNEHVESVPTLRPEQIVVYLSFNECLDFFENKINDLGAIICSLWEQRCKFYAHNDTDANFNIQNIISQYPFNHSDASALIDLAITITRFIIGTLTDIGRPEKYSNNYDWEATLIMVREGQIRINEQLSVDKYK